MRGITWETLKSHFKVLEVARFKENNLFELFEEPLLLKQA